QGEPADKYRSAAAAAPGVDHELDRRRMPQRAVAGRAPSELDLALLDFYKPPLARELVVGSVEPPHIVAGRIDELDLQLVHGRLGAQVERDLVVRRQIERQGSPRGGLPRGAAEIEVQPQRSSSRSR